MPKVDFNVLIMNVFNNYSSDTRLKQLSGLLVSRFNNHKAEFIRNVNRVELLLDNNDWLFYGWINIQINNYVNFSSKLNTMILEFHRFMSNIHLKVETEKGRVRLVKYCEMYIEPMLGVLTNLLEPMTYK